MPPLGRRREGGFLSHPEQRATQSRQNSWDACDHLDKKTDKELELVCTEIGTSTHMGEASMNACKYFGLNPDPKAGGSSDKKRWLYRFWPGDPAVGWKLQ